MEGSTLALDIPQALFFADTYINKGEFRDALACVHVIMLQPSNSMTPYLLKRAARLFAELNGALPLDDPKRQNAAAVQLLVFSKVKPNEWLGTQGVAAMMLNRESSRIGDVVMNYQNCKPILIQSDDYCSACNKVGTKGVCKACENAHYCSKECQLNDWQFHKLACATSRKCKEVIWNSTEPWQKKLDEVRNGIARVLK